MTYNAMPHAMPSHAKTYNATPYNLCHTMQRNAPSWLSSHTITCNTMQHYALQFHTKPYNAIHCQGCRIVLGAYDMQHHQKPFNAMLRHTTQCMPCHAMSFHTMQTSRMVPNHSIVGPMVDNHRKLSLPMVAWPKNHRKTIISNDCLQPFHSMVMVPLKTIGTFQW